MYVRYARRRRPTPDVGAALARTLGALRRRDNTLRRSSMTDRPLLTGLFRDRDSAERAYQSLIDRGYSKDDVNIMMSDETRSRQFGAQPTGAVNERPTELGTKAAKGAGIGAGVGGALGAVAAAVAAVGTTIALPGLGLVIAGPVAAALAGAGAGGAAGTLLGAMIG